MTTITQWGAGAVGRRLNRNSIPTTDCTDVVNDMIQTCRPGAPFVYGNGRDVAANCPRKLFSYARFNPGITYRPGTVFSSRIGRYGHTGVLGHKDARGIWWAWQQDTYLNGPCQYRPVTVPIYDVAVPLWETSGPHLDQLARDVIAGKYGSGPARRARLGSLYGAVQARVNAILGGR